MKKQLIIRRLPRSGHIWLIGTVLGVDRDLNTIYVGYSAYNLEGTHIGVEDTVNYFYIK